MHPTARSPISPLASALAARVADRNANAVFKGSAVPIKIKICDYFGAAVPNAVAQVFFGLESLIPTRTEAEPLANTSPDGGDAMRYDPAADQYIFNWDISRVENGTYQVWIDLGGGRCGEVHSVRLSVAKVGKGVKR